jgi:hypothetical protein
MANAPALVPSAAMSSVGPPLAMPISPLVPISAAITIQE